MRFVALLLLSAFVLAACSSGEITEVALTPSEQGDLRLSETNASELAELGLEENPGYMNAEKFSELTVGSPFSEPRSVYVAAYQDEDNPDSASVGIVTMVFNPEDLPAVKEAISSQITATEGELVVLHKGNTVVIVASSTGSYPATDFADKLSQRLGMEVLQLGEIGHMQKTDLIT